MEKNSYEKKVALDFAPGLHGHFLELVLNKYIYGVSFQSHKIFQSSGAVHAINVNQDYQDQKLVYCGHFSCFKDIYDTQTQKIVFIDHDPDLDFVLLTNSFYRCHPDSVGVDNFNVDEIIATHTSQLMTGDTDLDFRNNWFTKLNERHFEYISARPNTQLPVYNFDYKSFFELSDFCTELQNTAHFLQETFKFDQTLAELWQKFMTLNQGWALRKQAHEILQSTLANQNVPIPDDWKLHAYLNFRLSKMFDLYDGMLYNSHVYPATTNGLLAVIQEHLATFDSRW
jgi:hypothetical protein